MEDITFESWESLPPLTNADADELAEAIRYVLDAKRGKDIAVIPVEGRSDITDCFVLASANSGTHVRALADEVEFRMGQRGVQPLHTDGGDQRDWMVVDFGTVIVHIFNREAREFYHLDKLYAEPKSDAKEE
ncbi:MAG: ribosome silencing factor [Ruminococcaceae bacterium]|nr:ribosome silencing factor [Oscillospiraceae bacterium]